MENKTRKLLFDIRESLYRIDTFIGTPKVFEQYKNNLQLQQAVERNLEIIGEAMSRMA